MSTFLTWLSTFLINLIKTPLTHLIAYWAGKKAGRKEEQNAQNERSLDAIADAERARRNVSHANGSVHSDPFNRDA